MEFARPLGCLQHPDRARQNIIQRDDQVLRRDGRLRAEACDLAQGMHPRVGAAGTLGQDVFASDPSNGQR